ncbi:MAG: hypothetical protein GY932_04940 [Arcobacter sp.]|nr:hypothetical protein [Arcobacter sp.]
MKTDDIKNILENASNLNNSEIKTSHILSNISYEEVLALSDENNTLKIFTSSNDTFSLDQTSWKQVSPNDDEGYSTFVSTSDETIKLLIDETIVDSI